MSSKHLARSHGEKYKANLAAKALPLHSSAMQSQKSSMRVGAEYTRDESQACPKELLARLGFATYEKRVLVAAAVLDYGVMSTERDISMGSAFYAIVRYWGSFIGVGRTLHDIVADSVKSDAARRPLQAVENELKIHSLGASNTDERVYLHPDIRTAGFEVSTHDDPCKASCYMDIARSLAAA